MNKRELTLVQCKICDKLFFVPRMKAMTRYCSDACRKAGQRLRYLKWKKNRGKIKRCKICGKPLVGIPKEKRRTELCSNECRLIAHRRSQEKHSFLRKMRLRELGIYDHRPQAETKYLTYAQREERRIECMIRNMVKNNERKNT